MKQSIIKISDLPNFMDVEEVMEVKGGAVSGNTGVCVLGSAYKCNSDGAGVICNTTGSGVVCNVEGSGLVTGNKGN
jgi:hypothetical protein